MEVFLGVENEVIQKIAFQEHAASDWVKQNVLPFVNDVSIVAVVVGHGLLPKNILAPAVLPAMKALKQALIGVGQNGIYVTIPFQRNVLSVSFPPSKGTFDPSTLNIIKPIVDFLATHSPLLLCDLYPYYAYTSDPAYQNLPLNYALLNSEKVIVHDGSFGYTNMLDGMVDAFYSAMEKIGAPHVRIFVGETGWPFSSQTAQNARTYNANVIKRAKANVGTPKRPWALDILIYTLFRQNQAPGDKQQFGLYYPNGTPVY